MSGRTFIAKDAVRERVPVLVGLVGPSGSGKTFSALRIASGMQRVTGGDIYFVDTESSRALHYADQFRFKHVDFGEPFGSLDYLDALQQCVAAGARTIVIDSMSHEHEGPGGMIDAHEARLDKMAGDDWKKREAMNMLAWSAPKQARRQMINGILRLNANFVFCFRAKTGAKPVKKENGKTEIVQQGWMPITAPELIYEMTVNALLLPGAMGVPTWQSDEPAERAAMKLPRQFADLLKQPRALDEDIGQAIAEWARGKPPAPTFNWSEDDLERLKKQAARGRDAADMGKEVRAKWWAEVENQDELKAYMALQKAA